MKKLQPSSSCPNCWGFYEYAGKIRVDLYEEELDVQHHSVFRSFIRKWVIKYIEGIHLKRDRDNLVCHLYKTREVNFF